MSFTRRTALAALAAGAGLGAMPVSAESPLIVLAEPALREALMAAGWLFAAHALQPINYTFAATSALAAQIDNGAGADVLIGVEGEMLDLSKRGLITAPHRLYADRLALIAPTASKARLRVDLGMKLAPLLGNARLALAGAGTTEGGWSRVALARLKSWDAVKDRVTSADSAAAAVAMVADGKAGLGIAFVSEARSEPRVRVVDLFPLMSHPPIIYAGAATAISRNTNARVFLDDLIAAPMAAAFRGFDRP